MLASISGTLTALALGLLVHTAFAESPDTGQAPELPSEGLENIAWQLIGYDTEDGFIKIAADTKPTFFRFTAGQISGNPGCNRLTGAYRTSGESLAFDQGMAMTRKACAKPLMAQERAVLSALRQVSAYRIEGERLLMLDVAGNQILEFHAASRSPLVGHVWQLEDYDDGSGTPTTPHEGSRLDLTFLATGVLEGTDGCNRYMSGYRAEEVKLTIGPLATTRIRCIDDDDKHKHAKAYGAVLAKVAGFGIDGRRLTLVSSDGKPLIHYRSLEARPPETTRQD